MPQTPPLRTTLATALATCLLCAAFALVACAPGAEEPPDDRPLVVTTTNYVADLARRVGGDAVRVEALMGPGVDPHLYKASESDVRRLDSADLILYSGLSLEGKMGDILDKMERGRPVVAVAGAVPEAELLAPPAFTYAYDPHVWFDVSLWRLTLPGVADALAGLMPEQAPTFRDAAAAYDAELAELDAWVRQEISSIPEEQRVLVTAHDAFGYFGRAYGFEVVGLQGISTASEAGLQDVERVVELIAQRRIPAIFVESSVPRRAIEAVQAAVSDRGHEVAIGGTLYSDSMGAAGTPEGEYPGVVRSNVTTIVEALAPGRELETP
jgi:manganese/zinc/iron transport system substrate-binding protein